jgi:hypothetical protein
LRGLAKAKLKVHLAVIAYNLKRIGCLQGAPDRIKKHLREIAPPARPVTAPQSHRSTRSYPTLQTIKVEKIPPAHRSRFAGSTLVRSAAAAAIPDDQCADFVWAGRKSGQVRRGSCDGVKAY